MMALYKELAWIWSVMSPPGDYIEESRLFSREIKKYSSVKPETLLHLGCGGGHNDFTFKRCFKVTGLDLSPRMLALARKLNPQCRYIRGDMRRPGPGAAYDAVFAGDSINHMLSERDLLMVFRKAFNSLKPGGVFLVVQEFVKGKLEQNAAECVSNSSKDLRLTYVEKYNDPDPGDTTFECALVYLLGTKGGLRIAQDRFLMGIFGETAWVRLLSSAGFRVLRKKFRHSTFRKGQYSPMYICIKPKGPVLPTEEPRKTRMKG